MPSVTQLPVVMDPVGPTVPVTLLPLGELMRTTSRLYPGAFQLKVVEPVVALKATAIGSGSADIVTVPVGGGDAPVTCTVRLEIAAPLFRSTRKNCIPSVTQFP